LAHFCVIERRRDFDFAAGEVQVMHSADDGPGVPEPITTTFAFGRGVDVVPVTAVVLAGVVGGEPAASASVSGIAILSASDFSRVP
jgi:hypothetical protein